MVERGIVCFVFLVFKFVIWLGVGELENGILMGFFVIVVLICFFKIVVYLIFIIVVLW